MDWAAFTFAYCHKLESLFPHLVAIEAYKEAALNLVLPPDWSSQLDRLNRIRAVHGTTALEGNPLSEAEVSRQMEILEHEDLEDGSDRTTKEQVQIRNAGRAQAWIRQRFSPDSSPMSLTDILNMHRMITEYADVVNNEPGKLRTFPVTVGSSDMGGVHRGAPHSDLPHLMTEYIDFINSKQLKDQHPVVRALLSHFFLVTIHPFGDGNGRVSRLVEAGILFEGGYNVHGFYGLSNYFYRNEREYKTCLQECRNQQPFNVESFVTFGVKGFARELKGINNFIKTKLNRVVYRNMLLRAYHQKTGSRRRLLNQREYNLLEILLTETEPIDPFSENPSKKIKFSELRTAMSIRMAYQRVTLRTFYRELIRLGELGFIRFTKDDALKDWIIEINFEAIGKY
jgi:Fic family protein